MQYSGIRPGPNLSPTRSYSGSQPTPPAVHTRSLRLPSGAPSQAREATLTVAARRLTTLRVGPVRFLPHSERAITAYTAAPSSLKTCVPTRGRATRVVGSPPSPAKSTGVSGTALAQAQPASKEPHRSLGYRSLLRVSAPAYR